ncbi:MAG: Membrane protein, putative, partial [uncultured Thiotrichaceae bacterium]
MAGASLLTLLDDIATLLDDVSVMTKIAAKKTAGVLGDDLALNAEQVSGVKADRELPVVWAVAKGSFKNKLILVPGALAISAFIPWLITPLLMLGGAFLCYEGFEKVFHKLFAPKEEKQAHHEDMIKAVIDPKVDMVEFEKKKITGAIRTDFILSAEIIVIALGTVKDASFATQVGVVTAIAVGITVIVYGLVAGIVKLDDAGLYLVKEKTANLWGRFKRGFGQIILWVAPYLMKILTIVGTAAMFLVGGGILLHGIPGSHDVIHHWQESAGQIATVGPVAAASTPILLNFVAGIIAGGILVAMGTLIAKVM